MTVQRDNRSNTGMNLMHFKDGTLACQRSIQLCTLAQMYMYIHMYWTYMEKHILG